MFIFAMFIYVIVFAAAVPQWNAASYQYYIIILGAEVLAVGTSHLSLLIEQHSTHLVSRGSVWLIGSTSEQNEQVLLRLVKWF